MKKIKFVKLIGFLLVLVIILILVKSVFFKSKLSKLGYSNKEIKTIKNNLSKDEIKKINNYYENLEEYSSVNYFHIENIDRYDNLKEISNFSDEDIIMRVNTNVDKPFYTDIKTVDNPNNILVLVNKYYAFSQDYTPEDLIPVENTFMRSVAAEPMLNMVKAMREKGLTVNLLSGYRSYITQVNLYNRYANKDGKEKTDTYSARPGHSEHQSGLAMDLSNNWSLTEEFENTPEFNWLSEHAHEYGFILRYKKDKVYMTGYVYEPWHYRYVGVDVATRIHEENLTFEEYCVLYRGLY